MLNFREVYTPKTNITYNNGNTTMNEDVFPIEHGDFPASHVSFQGFSIEIKYVL